MNQPQLPTLASVLTEKWKRVCQKKIFVFIQTHPILFWDNLGPTLRLGGIFALGYGGGDRVFGIAKALKAGGLFTLRPAKEEDTRESKHWLETITSPKWVQAWLESNYEDINAAERRVLRDLRSLVG